MGIACGISLTGIAYSDVELVEYGGCIKNETKEWYPVKLDTDYSFYLNNMFFSIFHRIHMLFRRSFISEIFLFFSYFLKLYNWYYEEIE